MVGWQCMDFDAQNSVDTDDNSNNTAIVEFVNLSEGQTIWAQIMSDAIAIQVIMSLQTGEDFGTNGARRSDPMILHWHRMRELQ